MPTPTSLAALPKLPARFDQRAELPELMDDLAADPALTRQSLNELAFLNNWFGGYPIVLGALNGLLPQLRALNRPVRLLDLACGSGDVLRVIAQWAKRKNLPLEATGIDLNPVMVDYARQLTPNLPEVRFEVGSIWDEGLRGKAPDIVLSSQFCHHLPNAELVRFLAWIHQLAGVAVVVSDLHRHPLAFHFIKLTTRLFSKSIQVQYDAPLSVLSGMQRGEWKDALAAAGIKQYRLGWWWAFRWQIVAPK
jgi:SAM-dependent methyltransferase